MHHLSGRLSGHLSGRVVCKVSDTQQVFRADLI